MDGRGWLSGRGVRAAGVAGKVAVVTGSARGIGLATALELADRGAKIVLSDVLDGSLARAEDRLRSRSAEVLARRCDVTDPVGCDELVAAAVDRSARRWSTASSRAASSRAESLARAFGARAFAV